MFMYLGKNLFVSTGGYRYKERGNKYDIISPGLMAEDLKGMD